MGSLRSLDRRVPWVHFKLRRELELLDQFAGTARNRILLDVGAGWGDYLPHFLERGFTVVALDNDTSSLDRIGRLKPSECPLHLVAADGHRLPLADGVADVVVMGEVLEHLVAPDEALLEAYRVLRPGGHLFVDVPWWHELAHPWAAVALRTLQTFKATGSPPLLIRLVFRTDNGRVRFRAYTKWMRRVLAWLPSLRNTAPEPFIEGYLRGDRTGDHHRHFFSPGEWRRLVEDVGFRIDVVTGAWLAPPPLNRLEVFNRFFGELETKLGDGLLSRLAQILVLEAVKPPRANSAPGT